MDLSALTRKHTITAWIAALWSGEYDKVQYALRTENGFCVNGVLLDQIQKLEGLGFGWKAYDSVVSDGQQYELSRDGRGIAKNTIPTKIRRRMGLNELIGRQKLIDAFETALDREYPLNKDPDKSASITGFLVNLNDKTATPDTPITFKDMGHILYQIAVDVIEVNLPPKDEIKALADEGSCDRYTEERIEYAVSDTKAVVHGEEGPDMTVPAE